MPLATWPTGVPHCPIKDSFNVERTTEAPLASDMNSGTTRRRRRTTLRIAPVSLSLMLTHDEVALFKAFHEQTLSDGAARFTMPIYFAGVTATKTVAFAQPPSYAPFGRRKTQVNLSLLVEAL